MCTPSLFQLRTGDLKRTSRLITAVDLFTTFTPSLTRPLSLRSQLRPDPASNPNFSTKMASKHPGTRVQQAIDCNGILG